MDDTHRRTGDPSRRGDLYAQRRTGVVTGADRRQEPRGPGLLGALAGILVLLFAAGAASAFLASGVLSGRPQASPTQIAASPTADVTPTTGSGEPTEPVESPSPSPSASPSPSPSASPSPTTSPSPSPSPSASAVVPSPSLSPLPSASPVPTPTIVVATITPPPTTLTIEEPADGTVVRFTPVTLRGTAPAGSTVTHDIPFGFDAHTVAGRTGRWSLDVSLADGENLIVLRLGDDRTTEQRVRIILTR